MELAVLLEDAMDIHDRHWKIHWMLNFAQLSATMKLRATMERIRGGVDEELLGRLQNSAEDRNWDSVEGLWQMKETVKADPELRQGFVGAGAEIRAALEASEAGRRFVAEQLEPYQREFGWRAVWSHEFIFPTFREQPEPILEQVRGYLDTDYDYPSALETVRVDLEKASEELLAGLSGADRDELRRPTPSTSGWRRSPPTTTSTSTRAPTPGCASSWSPWGSGWSTRACSTQADDVLFLRYNELRAFVGDPSATDARTIVAERRAEREAAARAAAAGLGRHGHRVPAELPVLGELGLPGAVPPRGVDESHEVAGISGSPGVVEGIARVVRTVGEFDEVAEGDILVCQMTNPAWVVLFTKIAGLVTDTGGTTSHPAVLAREFGIPAVVGTSEAKPADQHRRPHPGRRHRRRCRDHGSGRAGDAPRSPSTDRRLEVAMAGPDALTRSVLADQVKERLLE